MFIIINKDTVKRLPDIMADIAKDENKRKSASEF